MNIWYVASVMSLLCSLIHYLYSKDYIFTVLLILLAILLAINGNKKSSIFEEPEDKYGNMAMLKKIRADYYCPKCDKELIYKDNECKFLICWKCGFEKPAPSEPKRNK